MKKNEIKRKKFRNAGFKILTLAYIFSFLLIVVTAPLPFLHHHKYKIVNIAKDTHKTFKKYVHYENCSLCDFYNNVFNTFYPDDYNITFNIKNIFFLSLHTENTISNSINRNCSRAPPVI